MKYLNPIYIQPSTNFGHIIKKGLQKGKKANKKVHLNLLFTAVLSLEKRGMLYKVKEKKKDSTDKH
jgi:hypothetical protein